MRYNIRAPFFWDTVYNKSYYKTPKLIANWQISQLKKLLYETVSIHFTWILVKVGRTRSSLEKVGTRRRPASPDTLCTHSVQTPYRGLLSQSQCLCIMMYVYIYAFFQGYVPPLMPADLHFPSVYVSGKERVTTYMSLLQIGGTKQCLFSSIHCDTLTIDGTVSIVQSWRSSLLYCRTHCCWRSFVLVR